MFCNRSAGLPLQAAVRLRFLLAGLDRRGADAVPVDRDADPQTGRYRDGAIAADLDARLDQVRDEVTAAGRGVSPQPEIRQRREAVVIGAAGAAPPHAARPAREGLRRSGVVGPEPLPVPARAGPVEVCD